MDRKHKRISVRDMRACSRQAVRSWLFVSPSLQTIVLVSTRLQLVITFSMGHPCSRPFPFLCFHWRIRTTIIKCAYNVYTPSHGIDMEPKVFLAQGIGSGCAAGLLYIPSMAVLSQYFNKRREQVMTFVSSGAYLGAVVHPIMLNNTINGQLDFANGVRASAGLISGLLLIASLLMRTRLPPSESRTDFLVAAKQCGRDSAFIFGCLGYVAFIFSPTNTMPRLTLAHIASPPLSWRFIIHCSISNSTS